MLPARDSQADYETYQEGEWGSEGAVKGEYGCRHDEQTEEEPKTREPNHDRRDQAADLRERESQKDYCAIKDRWQGLLDDVKFPGLGHSGCRPDRGNSSGGIEEHLEQFVVHLPIIRLEVRLHIENERRRHGRK